MGRKESIQQTLESMGYREDQTQQAYIKDDQFIPFEELCKLTVGSFLEKMKRKDYTKVVTEEKPPPQFCL